MSQGDCMTKAELRKHVRQLKMQHQETAKADSDRIMQAFEANPHFLVAQTVLLYHSLPDEVCTHDFINKWCDKKQILLPKVVGNDLELRCYHDIRGLKTGSFGIAEPTEALFTDYEKIDFAAVPGMAFDAEGNRLGRGKGYYDRLLPRLTNAYKAGICFPYQLVDAVPTEETDIKMDEVIC